MFLSNKYTKFYFKIVNYRQINQYKGYTEKHHIIPKAIGGDDDESNIVCLSAREHFICHLLLPKMHDSYKLKFALHMMTLNNGRHYRGYRITSRVFECIKRLNSMAATERNIDREYPRGNRKIYHNSLGEHKLFFINEIVPDGWFIGMSPERRKKIGKSNKGKVYYNDGVNIIAISKGELPPTGYVKGNPNADTSNLSSIRGSSYYYDPLSGNETRCVECPDGWISGRAVCWITDGHNNKQMNKIKDELPDGWWFGRTRRIINNGM